MELIHWLPTNLTKHDWNMPFMSKMQTIQKVGFFLFGLFLLILHRDHCSPINRVYNWRDITNSFDDATHRKTAEWPDIFYCPHPRGSFLGGFILIRKWNSWQKWYQHPDPVNLWNIVGFWYCICQDFPSNVFNCPWRFWCFESITENHFCSSFAVLKNTGICQGEFAADFGFARCGGAQITNLGLYVCICLKVSDVSKFATPENPPYCV